jgi:hypothetical protein
MLFREAGFGWGAAPLGAAVARLLAWILEQPAQPRGADDSVAPTDLLPKNWSKRNKRNISNRARKGDFDGE